MSQETVNHIPYSRPYVAPDEMIKKSEDYFQFMDQRRSLRYFSDKPVPKEVIANLIKAASTAPSGAHKQPWTFVAISNPELKKKIREAAEKEEYENYHGRMSDRWLQDLEPFKTNWQKPFLETVPWIVVAFKRVFEEEEEGKKVNNYYVNESVGLACGFFLTAVHQAGLVTLTHTPSPMNFLEKILDRPKNERAFLLLPIGYPAENAEVPELTRKPLEAVSVFFE